jgi:hypothetical protein
MEMSKLIDVRTIFQTNKKLADESHSKKHQSFYTQSEWSITLVSNDTCDGSSFILRRNGIQLADYISWDAAFYAIPEDIRKQWTR